MEHNPKSKSYPFTQWLLRTHLVNKDYFRSILRDIWFIGLLPLSFLGYLWFLGSVCVLHWVTPVHTPFRRLRRGTPLMSFLPCAVTPCPTLHCDHGRRLRSTPTVLILWRTTDDRGMKRTSKGSEGVAESWLVQSRTSVSLFVFIFFFRHGRCVHKFLKAHSIMW